MRKLVLFFLASLAAGGCNSASDVATKAPAETYSSSLSQAQVVNCLNERGGMDVSTTFQPDGTALVSVVSDLGNVGATFSVIRTGSGSRIEVRRTEWPILFNHRGCY